MMKTQQLGERGTAPDRGFSRYFPVETGIRDPRWARKDELFVKPRPGGRNILAQKRIGRTFRDMPMGIEPRSESVYRYAIVSSATRTFPRRFLADPR
jgi:hypothetical protein